MTRVRLHRRWRRGGDGRPRRGEVSKIVVSPDGAHLALLQGFWSLTLAAAGASTPRWRARGASEVGFEDAGRCWSWSAGSLVRRYAVDTGAVSSSEVETYASDLHVADARAAVVVGLRDGALVRFDLVRSGAGTVLAAGERWARVATAADGVALLVREDGALVAVDVADGTPLATLRPERRVAQAALGQGGRRLALAYRDGGVDAFDLDG